MNILNTVSLFGLAKWYQRCCVITDRNDFISPNEKYYSEYSPSLTRTYVHIDYNYEIGTINLRMTQISNNILSVWLVAQNFWCYCIMTCIQTKKRIACKRVTIFLFFEGNSNSQVLPQIRTIISFYTYKKKKKFIYMLQFCPRYVAELNLQFYQSVSVVYVPITYIHSLLGNLKL